MFELDPTATNIFPAKYRSVAISDQAPAFDEPTLREHFIGRDAYMRTRFLVLRLGNDVALAEVLTEETSKLFSPITDLRVLAGPDDCVWLERPDIDVGVAPQYAALASEHPDAKCLIVEGLYSHVSFLLNPAPLWIDVLDIVPPTPSKLADQAQRVLDIGEDLPPIGLRVDEISNLSLLEASPFRESASLLLPCKTAGVDVEGAAVSYLDQRPAQQDWALLGCSRSEEIHVSFYGDKPTRVDTCPRQFLSAARDSDGPTLTRCCLLQHGQEQRGRSMLVPWGSSLAEVREAIESMLKSEEVEWTPT